MRNVCLNVCAESVTGDKAGRNWCQRWSVRVKQKVALVLYWRSVKPGMWESHSQDEGPPALPPKIQIQITADIMSHWKLLITPNFHFLQFQGCIFVLLECSVRFWSKTCDQHLNKWLPPWLPPGLLQRWWDGCHVFSTFQSPNCWCHHTFSYLSFYN